MKETTTKDMELTKDEINSNNRDEMIEAARRFVIEYPDKTLLRLMADFVAEQIATQTADLQKRLAEAEAEIQRLREALERSELAIDDLVVMYSPELHSENDVARTRSRVTNNGGVLAYTADVQKQNRQALEQENQQEEGK